MKLISVFLMGLLAIIFTFLQVVLLVFEDTGIPVIEWGFARETELLPVLRLIISVVCFALFALLLMFSDFANYRRLQQKQERLDLIAL